jgi:hypothetical protein
VKEMRYTYITLRYIHDIATREFVNVGVVMYSTDQLCVGCRVVTNLDRVAGMFPDVKLDHLRALLSHAQAQVEILNTKLNSGAFKATQRVEDLVATVLPIDDSALQWGDVGGGVSRDLKRTLRALYDRLVCRYLPQAPSALAFTTAVDLTSPLKQSAFAQIYLVAHHGTGSMPESRPKKRAGSAQDVVVSIEYEGDKQHQPNVAEVKVKDFFSTAVRDQATDG